MKHASALAVTSLILTGASQAAYMATSLPVTGAGTTITPAGVAANTVYGSAFTIDPGYGFFADSVALYTGDASGFTTPQNVGIWELTGSTYNLLSLSTLSNTGLGSLTITGNNFDTAAITQVQMMEGSYFIGFWNAATGDNFLTKTPLTPASGAITSNQAAQSGAGAQRVTSSEAGFNFDGFGSFATSNLGGSNEFDSSLVRNGQFANMNVFSNLIAVPETGSVVMGAFLTGMAVSYRRRSKQKA